MDETPIPEIKTADDRVSFTGRVDELREPTDRQSKAGMHQLGFLSNDTGQIKFVSWKSDDPPTLTEGATYEFQDLRTDEFRGRYSVAIDDKTAVSEVEA